MFNFALNTREGGREGGGKEGGARPGDGRERREPGVTPPNPLPESPQYPPESPVEGPPGGEPGTAPGSGKGSSSDTGVAGGTTATPVEAGSFARPGMSAQMAAFNTLAPVTKGSRGGPGQAPFAGAPGGSFDQAGVTSTLDDLLRRLGLQQ